jgi:hypothetical protein
MSTPDFLQISDTRPKWMDGSDQPSGFANYKTKNTYLRNLRCPDLRCWMIATHVPPEIHGCGFLAVSGFNRSRTLSLETPDMPMALNFCHLSRQMDGSDLYRGFHCEFTRSPVHGIFDIPIPDASISRYVSGLLLGLRRFKPRAPSVNPMADGYLSEDPTAHDLLLHLVKPGLLLLLPGRRFFSKPLPPELLHFLPALEEFQSSQRPQPLPSFLLCELLTLELRLRIKMTLFLLSFEYSEPQRVLELLHSLQL